jgi:hypothetical protein
MDGDTRGRIAKLRRVIKHKAARKQNFDAGALELAVLWTIVYKFAASKLTPTQKILDIRG